MTRIVQTAMIAFGHLLNSSPARAELQIWPDLREAHDAICNKGVSRADMETRFPHFDFSACPEEWDYPPHSFEDAVLRAERVRQRVKDLSHSYKNIILITHRGFIAFLVQGKRFDVCGKFSFLLLFLCLTLTAFVLQNGVHTNLPPQWRGIRRDMVPMSTQVIARILDQAYYCLLLPCLLKGGMPRQLSWWQTTFVRLGNEMAQQCHLYSACNTGSMMMKRGTQSKVG
ncbi:hypothetical protein B0I35DRAFT_435557 [Stachybotrys elegans]|uniref:Uncharacterized protein n=1 Tax=Stachybotrys elegans TaxID=80388 RepID=A0A8K0WP31_9HYPO|nr:hypothetical protein B0I35DRAFT_435557 [Stachybotrys elegans]